MYVGGAGGGGGVNHFHFELVLVTTPMKQIIVSRISPHPISPCMKRVGCLKQHVSELRLETGCSGAPVNRRLTDCENQITTPTGSISAK